ncbi:MAG: hypothetical protein LAP40_09745 [Acidobacteriia bacterium]|nr:hypothetical protein [Terriglobia bacterium]
MKVLLLTCALFCARAETPGIHEIMLRVAVNQAKTQEARREFVYRQKQVVTMRRAGGQVSREEHREYEVAPADRGSHRKLLALQGRYRKNGDYILFDKTDTGDTGPVIGIEAGLIQGFSDDMTDDHDSRDGISNNQFPLTDQQQLKYDFRLLGQETVRGRRVYRVAFQPRHRYDWKGEALIDAEEYQPVFVTTRVAHGLPLAVKMLLGTDIRGYGFSVSYQKFDDGAWFPVSYGGEFELRALFFYKRTISISMTNSDFHRADVNSRVTYLVSQP